MITDADMPEGYKLVESTAELLVIVDAEQPDLRLRAELDEDGDIIFSVKAEDIETGRRGVVSGSVLFDLMIRHFDEKIRTITAWWSGETNYRMFKDFLSEGATIHEAASNTWTGTQVLRHGFLALIVTHWTVASPEGSVQVVHYRRGSRGDK